MKKIIMIALLAGFISTATAKNSIPNLLVKPNVNNSSLLSNVGIKSFRGFCIPNCVNSYNTCMDNATTSHEIQGCSAKWESCMARCGVEGGPNP